MLIKCELFELNLQFNGFTISIEFVMYNLLRRGAIESNRVDDWHECFVFLSSSRRHNLKDPTKRQELLYSRVQLKEIRKLCVTRSAR